MIETETPQILQRQLLLIYQAIPEALPKDSQKDWNNLIATRLRSPNFFADQKKVARLVEHNLFKGTPPFGVFIRREYRRVYELGVIKDSPLDKRTLAFYRLLDLDFPESFGLFEESSCLRIERQALLDFFKTNFRREQAILQHTRAEGISLAESPLLEPYIGISTNIQLASEWHQAFADKYHEEP